MMRDHETTGASFEDAVAAFNAADPRPQAPTTEAAEYSAEAHATTQAAARDARAELARAILDQRFGITKFRAGYDLNQVDDLLDQTMIALKADEDPAQITARILGAGLQQTRWRDGYAVEQVDGFLAELIPTVEALPPLR